MVIDKDYMDQLAKGEEPPRSGAAPAPAPAAVEKPKLTTISAAALQEKDLPPLEFVVDGLLPHGLALICSPPKYYKSWMMLDLGLRVASGKPFLGRPTNQCGCLYLALEDSQRRLKSRMDKLLGNENAPTNFYFSTESSSLENGLLETLEDFVQTHADVGLVIIDTFQCIRSGARMKETAYATDYREMASLKQFADRHHVALLLVHHLRKMRDDGDPFNMISGTNGIMGAADTIFVLSKEHRDDANATFSVVGRDVEGSETVLAFDANTCRWAVVGSAQDVAAEQSRRSYEANPIVRAIKALLAQNPAGWRGTMTELLVAGQEVTGSPLASGPRDLTAKLQVLDDLLAADGIAHTRAPHGTGGGKHSFAYTSLDLNNIPDIQF